MGLHERFMVRARESTHRLALRCAAGIAARVCRRHTVVLALFTITFFATTIVRARSKPFWHDEIYTILISRLPSVSVIWKAAVDGADLMPPLNSLLTRLVHLVGGVGLVSTRLPAMIGVWTMCVVAFELVRRRSNVVCALAAAVLPCFTAAYRYSCEARGYGVMLGLFALSLWAWSEAAQGRRRGVTLPLLAITLAAGTWTHYYALLGLIPIAVGEAIRVARDRKPDWPVWAAVGASLVGALPLRPLMIAASAQSKSYWRHAEIADLGGAYRFLVEPLLDQRFLVAGVAIVGILTVGILTGGAGTGRRRRLPSHEVGAGLACLLVPLFAVLASMLSTGAFVPRYALAGVVGLSMAIPLAVWCATPRSRLAEIVLCVVLAGSFAQSVYDSLRPPGPVFHDPVKQRPLLRRELAGPRPVLVTGGVMFLQLWYYTPPELRGRLWYAADPAEALRYTGSDTIDRGYLTLRRWTAVTVQEYRSFVAAHREFTVYAAGSGWLLDKLRDAGASLEENGSEPGAVVWRVALRPFDSPPGRSEQADTRMLAPTTSSRRSGN